jgi:Tfp pilus assembly protein PilV
MKSKIRTGYQVSISGHRDGQSLIEVMIGLVIGGVLIVAAIFAISAILQTNQTLQQSQAASGLNQDLLNRMVGFAAADWQNVATLPAGASTAYFLVASGSVSFAVAGKEGVIDNDVTNGLVGRWGFDEASGAAAYDGTGNMNTGTLANGALQAPSSSCWMGGCLYFSGLADSGGGAKVTAARAISFPGSFTFSHWVKTTSSASQMYTIGNTVGANGYRFGFIVGRVAFLIGDGTTFTETTCSTSTVADGGWHLLTGVFTRAASSSVTCYIDAVPQMTVSLPSSYAGMGSFAPTFGSPPCCASLKGFLDDVRMYNRALSASEVKQIVGSNKFTRFFSLENVCRTTDASGTIASTLPSCSGGSARDPSTLSASVATQWQARTRSGEVRSNEVLVRSRNTVLWQTDWSGSVAQGPLTEAGNGLATSSGIGITSGGSLRVFGL